MNRKENGNSRQNQARGRHAIIEGSSLFYFAKLHMNVNRKINEGITLFTVYLKMIHGPKTHSLPKRIEKLIGFPYCE